MIINNINRLSSCQHITYNFIMALFIAVFFKMLLRFLKQTKHSVKNHAQVSKFLTKFESLRSTFKIKDVRMDLVNVLKQCSLHSRVLIYTENRKVERIFRS